MKYVIANTSARMTLEKRRPRRSAGQRFSLDSVATTGTNANVHAYEYAQDRK